MTCMETFMRATIPATILLCSILSACGSSNNNGEQEENNVKESQAPLVFEHSNLRTMIDNLPEENDLVGGSGTGVITWQSSNPEIVEVGGISGDLTLLDDGTVAITATKAGDEQFESTSASYVLTVEKYPRLQFQFVREEVSAELSNPLVDNPLVGVNSVPRQTSEVEMDMNLAANSTPLPPDSFDPNDTVTYNSSLSLTVYDSLGDSHLYTLYFLRDASAEEDEWLVVTALDGNLVSFQNGDGSAAILPAANSIGRASGINGVDGFGAARLTFSDIGDFTNVTGADNMPITSPLAHVLLTEPLGSAILSNGSDVTQQIRLNFNLDPNGEMTEAEPTQIYSYYEIIDLLQDGYAVGEYDASLVSYSSNDTDVATIDQSGVVTPISYGLVTITANIEESFLYKAAEAHYLLSIQN